MFAPTVAVGELILRAVIVYVFVFMLLRLLGKRHVGEMGPFDLVILLILSESVQNALVADDKSVAGGLIVASTLFGISQLVGFRYLEKQEGGAFSGRYPAYPGPERTRVPRRLGTRATDAIGAARGIAKRRLHLTNESTLRDA